MVHDRGVWLFWAILTDCLLIERQVRCRSCLDLHCVEFSLDSQKEEEIEEFHDADDPLALTQHQRTMSALLDSNQLRAEMLHQGKNTSMEPANINLQVRPCYYLSFPLWCVSRCREGHSTLQSASHRVTMGLASCYNPATMMMPSYYNHATITLQSRYNHATTELKLRPSHCISGELDGYGGQKERSH